MPEKFDDQTFKQAVAQALEIRPEEVKPEIALGSLETWDSLNHMNLIIAVEETFNIRFASDEIPKLQTLALLQQALLTHLGKG